MKKYDSYKDSGVQWIGEVPSHWEVKRIKTLSPVRRGASPRPIDNPIYFDENGEYSWVRIADVTASEMYLIETTQKLSKLGSSLSVKQYPGDLFVSIAGTVGKPIITNIKCCIHDGFVYFTNLHFNRELLYYIFKSGRPYLGLGKMGTQLNLNTETIGNIRVPVPPEDEQQAIADFLDAETSKVDGLIEKQEKQIELLEEMKTAIISQAVTKGLNTNVPMKESGIEWIGEIPEDWEVTKLNFACHTITDFVASGSFADLRNNVEYLDDPDYAMLVRTADLSGKSAVQNHVYISKDSYNFLHNSNLYGGEIILPNIGASIGDVYEIPYDLYDKMSLGPNAIMLKSNTHNKFLYYYFSSKGGRESLELMGIAAAQGKFNKTDLRQLRVLIPPIDVQEGIIDYLDKESSKIDMRIARHKRQIELLNEYKSTLISDVVTGKIKVYD